MSRLERGAIGSALGASRRDAATAASRLADEAARQDLLDVAYAGVDTPLGAAVVAATRRGLVRVGLPGEASERLLEELAEELSPRVLEAPLRLDPVRRELDEYFAGRRREFTLELDWTLVRRGFQGRVLRAALRRLPFGVTASYGELAAWAGSPRAWRAAGTALARNPLPIVVPCHRVLQAGGRIGSYGGGPQMKARLLRLEGALGGDDDKVMAR